MADETDKNLPPAQFFNTMRIAHSQREFFIEFGQASTDSGVAVLIGRFATTPAHLKEMIAVLSNNLSIFESKFGEVQIVRGETRQ